MTKANKFSKAISNMNAEREFNATNKKKVQKCALIANDKRVYDMLIASNVDASKFNARALYATEKCVTTVQQVTRDHADTSKNTNALVALKCASLCAQHNAALSKSDIESALLSDRKIDAQRDHLIYQRKAKISAVAQVQQCIDMLKTLNISKQITRDTFEIDKDNKILQAFEEKFADVAI